MKFLHDMCSSNAFGSTDESEFEQSVVTHSSIALASLRASSSDGVAAANKWCEQEFGLSLSQLSSGFKLFFNGKLIEAEPTLKGKEKNKSKESCTYFYTRHSVWCPC